MWQQRSYNGTTEYGNLYIVPTPIGNLEDMTFRSINTLKEADVIAAEDTRQTRKLCHYYEVSTTLVSYHEHNKKTSGQKLLQMLKEGNTIALVSDAGMPGVSDPGYELVAVCIEEKINVIPLPGANAALPALVASGLPTDHFYFYGFLPRDKKSRNEELEKLSLMQTTMVFYESPHRLKETLKAFNKHWSTRKISIARELTKKFEEFIRGTVEEVYQWSLENVPKGEFCLIVEGSAEVGQEDDNWWKVMSIIEHVDYYIEQENMKSKDAIKQVAKDRNVPKREVYQAYHVT